MQKLRIYNVRVRILILRLGILLLTILPLDCRIYKVSVIQVFCSVFTKIRGSENSLKNVIKVFLKEEVPTFFDQGHSQRINELTGK